MKVILMVFTKKIVQGKWAILGPNMAHLRNSGPAQRIFLKNLLNERG